MNDHADHVSLQGEAKMTKTMTHKAMTRLGAGLWLAAAVMLAGPHPSTSVWPWAVV